MENRTVPGFTRPVALKLGFVLLFLAGVSGCSSFHGRGIRYQLDHQYSVHDPQFLRSMGHLVGPAILAGNRASALINGERIFPAMLEAIRGAQKSITSRLTFTGPATWAGSLPRRWPNGRARG